MKHTRTVVDIPKGVIIGYVVCEGVHDEACPVLSREVGRDVESIIEEWRSPWVM